MYPSDLEKLVQRLFTEPELVKKIDFNSNSGTHVSGDSVRLAAIVIGSILVLQAVEQHQR